MFQIEVGGKKTADDAMQITSQQMLMQHFVFLIKHSTMLTDMLIFSQNKAQTELPYLCCVNKL